MTKLERVQEILAKAIDSLPEGERQIAIEYIRDIAAAIRVGCELADLTRGAWSQREADRLAQVQGIVGKWV